LSVSFAFVCGGLPVSSPKIATVGGTPVEDLPGPKCFLSLRKALGFELLLPFPFDSEFAQRSQFFVMNEQDSRTARYLSYPRSAFTQHCTPHFVSNFAIISFHDKSFRQLTHCPFSSFFSFKTLS